ncbi:MAG: hypothetical protein KC649_06405 [Candidatus Omnitrophica bacterium]|nr:hypothetical protein [Candidatus Omnitrophota bacterium]
MSFRVRWKEFRSYAAEEFFQHLPYTIFGILFGLAMTALLMLTSLVQIDESLFHQAHFLHLFFSGAASAAIFKTYNDSLLKAVPVAFISSVALCTVSDVLIPMLGLSLFGYQVELHLCIQEHPVLISLGVLAGIWVGLLGIRFFSHCNRSFHMLHILISTIASTLYLLMFIDQSGFKVMLLVATVLIFALAIPCLVGDMVLPLTVVSMTGEDTHQKVHHSHD